ncbi:hypothetical protein A4X06_0g7878 [Tilletia controversa]|uniref:Uncharacterized protein n=1 Tax=Tilletia controversa TaxID=13291 RepID=A0A8X7MLB4_9BASI|nr:hypothetical protein A4X06_0g7878 [Tilletia controversa]
MVAPHSSSVIRTGDGYLALQQEQRAESASALALPHLRSASSSPAHIKDEVGIPSGLTASADKGNHSPSAPGAERSTSMGLDALEQAQSDAECALLLLCLQDQRPDLGAIQAPAVLDATLRASWRSVEWKEQGSIEDGYLLALDRYRSHLKCRKRRPEQDALPHVPFSLLNAEIRSAQTLLAHVRAGDRRAELELATAVQSWSWRIDTFGNSSSAAKRSNRRTPAVDVGCCLTIIQPRTQPYSARTTSMRPLGAMVVPMESCFWTFRRPIPAVSAIRPRSAEWPPSSSTRRHYYWRRNFSPQYDFPDRPATLASSPGPTTTPSCPV